ncbi:MAG: MATE family efflux transporter [Bacillota bacterium]
MQTAGQKDYDLIGKESITKLLFRYSLPATVGMVSAATYNVVDTIFIGRLGSEAIAALSIAFPIQMILGAIGVGVGVGSASLISRSLGSGNVQDAERAVGQVVSLALAFGLLIAVASFFYLRPLLLVFGASPEIIGYTEEYTSVITNWAVVFFMIMSLNNVTRAEGSPLLSMKIMVVSSLSNIVLDPIFIFALDMGVRGAAVATVLAKFVGAFILLYHFSSGRSNVTFYIKNMSPDWYIIKNIYKIGFPSMLRLFSRNISLGITNVILATFGHIPIAVMGLFFRLLMLIIMPVVGFAQGLLPVIGYNYGAEKSERIREAVIKGFTISTAFITALTLLVYLNPYTFLGFFTSEAELLEMGAYSIRIMLLMVPLIGIQVVSAIFFQAIGKAVPSLILSILREVLIYVPLLLIFSAYSGLHGVWVARPASDFLAFVITFIMIARELKRQNIPLRPQPAGKAAYIRR